MSDSKTPAYHLLDGLPDRPLPRALTAPEAWTSRALTLRRALREQVPFSLRIALRRAPALLRHYRSDHAPSRGNEDVYPFVLAERASPLRRPGTTYSPELQRAKEQNVTRAASLLNGLLLAPGEAASWHAVIGPPLGFRGFAQGPELHDGALARGSGGGLCQVANLTLFLALMSGADILERHRHGLDLFPDADRDVPFGCGATVFYPHRDLRFRNTLSQPLLLSCAIRDGHLVGQARTATDPGWRFEILEQDHRFYRGEGGIFRENLIARRRRGPDGQDHTEVLFGNAARVLYDPPPGALEGDESP